MAEMNPVNWFEIPATDLARATTFYESLLQLELEPTEMGEYKMSMFPMAQGAPGAAGALVMSAEHQPSETGITVYFYVADLDAAVARVTDNGGTVLMPKTSIGEYGFMAHFKDTEGNHVALHCPTG